MRLDTVKIIIVDDHEIVRLGLITLFEDIEWIDVVAEAGTGEEAVLAVAAHQPDVVLMDIRLPNSSGIDACQTITSQWPETKIIMLTSYGNESLILQALQAGACCYILKQVGNQTLIENLHRIQCGDKLFTPYETQQVLDSIQEQMSLPENVFADLTQREMQVLAHIAQGLTNAQIAQAISASEQTVCNDINTVLTKLPVNNRFEAAIFALHHNINFSLPE